MTRFVLGAMLIALGPLHLVAQSSFNVRTSFLAERYEFVPDSGQTGLLISSVTQNTIPIVISGDLGRLGNFTVSSAYTNVFLESSDQNQLTDQKISGLLDTEVRLGVNVVPGRLVLLLTGTVPTGLKTIQYEELAIVGSISSDLIGFSAPNLGSGGNAGGGFAGAIPLGKFALGFAGSYKQQFGYNPIINDTTQLRPGSEGRVRLGFEGPLLRRTYVRAAFVYALRDKDRLDGAVQNGIGNRIIGYASVNQGFGSSALTVYAFDVFRGSPQLEPTATGAAVLPRGNLFAAGVRWAFEVGRRIELIPRGEIRMSDAAVDIDIAAMQRLGSSSRVGLDVRARLNRKFAFVVQGDALLGSVFQGGERVPMSGFRGGVHLEVIP